MQRARGRDNHSSEAIVNVVTGLPVRTPLMPECRDWGRIFGQKTKCGWRGAKLPVIPMRGRPTHLGGSWMPARLGMTEGLAPVAEQHDQVGRTDDAVSIEVPRAVAAIVAGTPLAKQNDEIR